MQALQGRWATDGRSAVPDADPAALTDLGLDLVARWAEPHRRYHGPVHLLEVLAAVDTLCRTEGASGRERSVAVMGAWFHDAVYDLREDADNERRSAALAARSLAALGADPDLVDDVVTVVLDTAAHDLDDVGPGAEVARVVLHDADLWVLSAPTPRFDAYCREVREEYRHVPAGAYASARTAVLRPFLVRDHVYRTEHARRTWEPTARENLARELTRLAG